jgi:lipopolysaccharide biosynthesis glycosyltransferase
MKRLIYQVCVGKPSNLYNMCTKTVEEYAEKIGADYIKQTNPILRIKPDVFSTNRSKESYEKYGGYLPIFEKENAFAYLGEYDQVAIIDADVYIRDTAPDIFKQLPEEYDFGGVVEREMPLTNAYINKIKNYSRMQYGSIDLNWKWHPQLGGEFFNMGVMVMNKSLNKYLHGQTPAEFLNRLEFKKFIDGLGPWKWSTDQTLLNVWIKKEKIKAKHFDWKWNGLFTANTKIQDCHFVHFFLKDKLPNKGEDIDSLLEKIKP